MKIHLRLVASEWLSDLIDTWHEEQNERAALARKKAFELLYVALALYGATWLPMPPDWARAHWIVFVAAIIYGERAMNQWFLWLGYRKVSRSDADLGQRDWE